MMNARPEMHDANSVMNRDERKDAMMKTSESLAKATVTLIHRGFTWESVEKELGRSKHTIQAALHKHYSKSGGKESPYYRSLLKMARTNAKLALKTSNEVHILETGYILKVGTKGVEDLVNNKMNVVIPLFCIAELTKMQNDHAHAAEFLNSDISKKVVSLFVAKEVFYNAIPAETPNRLKAITALAVDLDSSGFNVVVHTNSMRLKQIINLQNTSIDVACV